MDATPVTGTGAIRRATRAVWFAAVGCISMFGCITAHGAPPLKDLADFTLEQLGDIEVTSVSRRPERLIDAPASVFVITGDDIRRSGATSLPEALRIAPNLFVARTTSNSWSISARGFNSSGNKLLVLIDGRIVYTPLFSGVFWDAQDVMLEDVERIEVISGPGATLWGANAVNGVINVTTRSAQDTQGALVTAGGGNLTQGAAARYGGTLASGARYRVYGKYFNYENTERRNGTPVADDWTNGQVGFRTDWGDAGRGFTLIGNAYHVDKEQAAPGEQRVSGVNLLGAWRRPLSDTSSIRVQAYYDRTQRNVPGTFSEHLDIFDIEFQHSMRLSAAQQLIWGAGYRYAFDRVDNTTALAFLPADKNLKWANIFVQDEIALSSNVHFTLGIKAESNVYTNLEWLPSARIAWKVAPEHLLWAAASRAVRAPSRLDRELFIPGNAPFLLAGGPNFQSEVSKVYEIGYRGQPVPEWSYSVTVFHHDYDRLRSIEAVGGGVFMIDNKMDGLANGVEAWGTYHITPVWRVTAGVVEMRQKLGRSAGSTDPTGPAGLGNDPERQWALRTSYNQGRHEFDVAARYVGSLPNPSVPSYTAFDLRWGWHMSREIEWSLSAQNLFGPGHVEFGNPATASVIEPSVFLKFLWRR